MWTWNADPFGTDSAHPNPSGASTFAYNLRFLGQLFDGQAGLHYNGLRDFDPAVGRYVQSDPIGQGGGLDPYLFAINNPIEFSDPNGLSPLQWWWYLNLPKTDDCKQSEWDYCTTKCSPFKALGCYVTLKWKLKGLRGGNPIRSEQRNVECRCEDPDDCPLREHKKGRANQQSPDGYLLPWWWREAAGALL
jgi:RHS repeat-associated protein